MTERVLVVCDDLFFWARIEAAARALGRIAVRVAGEEAMQRAWAEDPPRRIVADLGAKSLDVLGWAARWKSRESPPEIVGFVSHLDLATQERARGAGFDTVLPNSRFFQGLSALL